jgi:enamine deaminase RidA (YjgF/YER057c/UK114 family)
MPISELQLPEPPAPFGAYVEAVQTGNLLFLTGMLPTAGRAPAIVGRLGDDVGVDAGRKAARLCALNALAVAKHHLARLDRVIRVVRLGVYIAAVPEFRDHPAVADGASELLLEVFGPTRNSARSVFGVASLPLGCPVEVELTIEVAP